MKQTLSRPFACFVMEKLDEKQNAWLVLSPDCLLCVSFWYFFYPSNPTIYILEQITAPFFIFLHLFYQHKPLGDWPSRNQD